MKYWEKQNDRAIINIINCDIKDNTCGLSTKGIVLESVFLIFYTSNYAIST